MKRLLLSMMFFLSVFSASNLNAKISEFINFHKYKKACRELKLPYFLSAEKIAERYAEIESALKANHDKLQRLQDSMAQYGGQFEIPASTLHPVLEEKQLLEGQLGICTYLFRTLEECRNSFDSACEVFGILPSYATQEKFKEAAIELLLSRVCRSLDICVTQVNNLENKTRILRFLANLINLNAISDFRLIRKAFNILVLLASNFIEEEAIFAFTFEDEYVPFVIDEQIENALLTMLERFPLVDRNVAHRHYVDLAVSTTSRSTTPCIPIPNKEKLLNRDYVQAPVRLVDKSGQTPVATVVRPIDRREEVESPTSSRSTSSSPVWHTYFYYKKYCDILLNAIKNVNKEIPELNLRTRIVPNRFELRATYTKLSNAFKRLNYPLLYCQVMENTYNKLYNLISQILEEYKSACRALGLNHDIFLRRRCRVRGAGSTSGVRRCVSVPSIQVVKKRIVDLAKAMIKDQFNLSTDRDIVDFFNGNVDIEFNPIVQDMKVVFNTIKFVFYGINQETSVLNNDEQVLNEANEEEEIFFLEEDCNWEQVVFDRIITLLDDNLADNSDEEIFEGIDVLNEIEEWHSAGLKRDWEPVSGLVIA